MIPRHALPQIPKEKYKEFVDFLKNNGVQVEVLMVPTNQLKPIQGHINRDKVENMKKDRKALKLPVLCSQGGLILDGHHRWVSRDELGEEKTPAIIAHCPIRKLVELGHQFEGSTTKTIYESTQYTKQIFEKCEDEEELPELMVRKTLKWK